MPQALPTCTTSGVFITKKAAAGASLGVTKEVVFLKCRDVYRYRMISRLGVLLFPSFLLLFLAVLEEGFTSSGDSQITINFADVSRDDVRITIPPVDSVLLVGIKDLNINDTMCPIMEHPDEMQYSVNISGLENCSVTLTTLRTDRMITLYLTVDTDRTVACRDYIFNVSLENIEESVQKIFTCEPVFASNPTFPNSTQVEWRKFNCEDDLFEFCNGTNNYDDHKLTPGPYSFPDGSSDGTLSISLNNSNTSLELEVRRGGEDGLGFYVPAVNGECAALFAVYLSPEIIGSSDRNYSVIYNTKAAETYERIRCEMGSFPPAEVQWEVDGDPLNENDNIYFRNIGTCGEDLRYTIDGIVGIREVQYSDAGTYKCTGINPASGERVDRSRKLRVRDPLRPLWPSLGIVGTIIIMVAFMIGSHFYDKWRGDRALNDEDEVDEGPVDQGRHFSVASQFEDTDGPNNSSKDHPAIRRVSSGRQQLLSET